MSQARNLPFISDVALYCLNVFINPYCAKLLILQSFRL